MPRRTNGFQQLIAIIQSLLDPGSAVAESVLLEDTLTGTRREVDVVVTGNVGAQAVTVSIECRDRARDSDVTWVDAMQGKHARLKTNVLVLASHSPFTPEAIAVAGRYGIRCLQLSDEDPKAPGRLFPDVASLWGKGWEISIDRVEVFMDDSGSLPSERFKASPETALFLDDGSPAGAACEFVNAVVRSSEVVDRMHRESKPEHTFLELVLEPPRMAGCLLAVQKQEPVLLRPIARLRIIAKCKVTVDEFPLRHGVYGDVRVAWGRGTLLGRSATVVAIGAVGAAPQIAIRMESGDNDAG